MKLPLTQLLIRSFVESLPVVQAFADSDRGQEVNGALARFAANLGEPPYKPFSLGAELMSEHFPKDADRIDHELREYGFSLLEWGEIGDRILIAHQALKAQQDGNSIVFQAAGLDRANIIRLLQDNGVEEGDLNEVVAFVIALSAAD